MFVVIWFYYFYLFDMLEKYMCILNGNVSIDDRGVNDEM